MLMQQVNDMTETATISHKKGLSDTQIQLSVLSIALLGLCLRLVGLGSIPLSAGEAQAAWQAL